MNKRKKKKQLNKRELFASSFASSYKEVKQLDRSYHLYVIECKKKERYNKNHGIVETTSLEF